MAAQELRQSHQTDTNGNPAGGSTVSMGMSIIWQRGPLRTAEGEERAPNGCFVETVIAAAAGRLEYYQGTKFACGENVEAIEHLQRAMEALERRTASRVAREVEGTHEV